MYGRLTRRNLAVLAAERGDREEAVRLWGEVLAECAGDREALANRKRPRREMPGGPNARVALERLPRIVPESD
jgi:hypothetical protein